MSKSTTKKATPTKEGGVKTLTLKGDKSVNELLSDCLSFKADELSYEAMAYLAMTLIKTNVVIKWKDLVVRFNQRSKGLPTASMFSDPSAGAHDGWNIRNWWWNLQHHADTGCHAQGSGVLHLKAINMDAKLVKKLHARFFKAAK